MPEFMFSEDATPLEPGEASGLLLSHITTRGELDRWEQENIIEALLWLDKAKPKDVLNEQFIKELHRRMFGRVWRWAGSFRKSDKNLGIDWQLIPVSLRNLLEDAQLWIRLGKDPADEIAVRFHHRLVCIHPFANGNGRHARLLADVLLENVFGPHALYLGQRRSAVKTRGHQNPVYQRFARGWTGGVMKTCLPLPDRKNKRGSSRICTI